MAAFYDRINNYHKKPLHEGQIAVARDYFVRGIRIIMSQWGRNAGKTQGALYLANVAAALNDNFIIYIITPERKQGKEIYWASRRLQDYPPPELIESAKESEQRLIYKNGSFVCIEGCENYSAHRGLKPNLVIYDEFQDHSKEFHLEVMAPNLLGKNAALAIFGTPPKARSTFYVEFRDQLLKQIKSGDVTRSYHQFKTEVNPAIDRDELAKIRRELFESGNEVIWYREYEGALAFGGEDIVFPKWSPAKHQRTHLVTMSFLETDKHKLKWFTICDPGTSTCFAVLFIAYNEFTRQVFILDEIYEKDRKRSDSKSMWERILAKEKELFPSAPEKTWKRIYDEAASWFANEIRANYKVGLIPTQKQLNKDEEADISNIKMLMASPGSLHVSERCYWLRWEFESYITDQNGNYVDKNNHLIDCVRYFMRHINWRMLEKVDPEINNIPQVQTLNNETNAIEPSQWADNIVENSLGVSIYDLYDDYFID